MKFGSFAMVCHAVVACANFDKALERIVRFFNPLLDDFLGSISVVNGDVRVTATARDQIAKASRLRHELHVMLLQGILSSAIGRQIALRSPRLSYPARSFRAGVRGIFYGDLKCDATNTEISFTAEYFALRVVQNAKTLKTFLRNAPDPILVKYKWNSSWALKIRDRLGDAQWERMPTPESNRHRVELYEIDSPTKLMSGRARSLCKSSTLIDYSWHSHT